MSDMPLCMGRRLGVGDLSIGCKEVMAEKHCVLNFSPTKLLEEEKRRVAENDAYGSVYFSADMAAVEIPMMWCVAEGCWAQTLKKTMS